MLQKYKLSATGLVCFLQKMMQNKKSFSKSEVEALDKDGDALSSPHRNGLEHVALLAIFTKSVF